MESLGLFFIALALCYIGTALKSFMEVYGVLSGHYNTEQFRKRYSKLKVFFLLDDEKAMLLIGRNKYELNPYEEYLVRENLGVSESCDKVKVKLDDNEILALIHRKLYIKDIDNQKK